MSGRMLTALGAAAIAGGLLLAAHQPHLSGTGRIVHIDPLTGSAQSGYLAQARAAGAVGDDRRLLAAGAGLCHALAAAPNPTIALRPLNGITVADTRALADAATRHLCPAQRPKIASFLEGDRP